METAVGFVREWEWVLLLAVAALEAAILVNAVLERREREHLISEMQSTRVELGRESYIAMKKEALSRARRYVAFVSHSLNSDLTNRDAEKVFRLYRQADDLRCITANDPSRLRDIWEQHRHGVEVRVSPVVLASTFRFQVSDDRDAVLGFSKEGQEMSVKGIRVGDPHFARMLRKHFDDLWDESVPWLEMARTFLGGLPGDDVEATCQELCAQWGLTSHEADEFWQSLSEGDGMPSRRSGAA